MPHRHALQLGLGAGVVASYLRAHRMQASLLLSVSKQSFGRLAACDRRLSLDARLMWWSFLMLSSTWQWLSRVPDVEVQWCNQIRSRTWLGFEVGLAVGEAWGDWGVTHTLGWCRTFRHINFSRAGIGSDAAKEKHFEFNSCCQAAPSVSCPFS